MTLNQMLYFSTVCNTKNISIAAKMLYISQPALSSSLASLEKEVGFRLFYRKSKGISPTEEALILLKQINDVLSKVNQIHQELPLISKRQNVIRIVFRPYVGEDTFFRLCPIFKKSHPEIDFSVHEIATQKTYMYLVEDQVDFIFSTNKALPSSLKSHYECCKVGTEHLHFFVNENSPLAMKREITLKDFEDYPMVFWEGHQLMKNELQQKMAEQGRVLNVISVMPQLSGILQFVRNNLAMAFLPGIFANDIPGVCGVPVSQEIINIVTDGESEYSIYAYWHKNAEKYEGKKAFLNFLKKQCKKSIPVV